MKFYLTILCFLTSLYWSLPWMCWHVHKVAVDLFLNIFLSESSCDTSHHIASFSQTYCPLWHLLLQFYLGFSSLFLKINCLGQKFSCQTHFFQSLWSSSRPVGILLQLTRVVGFFSETWKTNCCMISLALPGWGHMQRSHVTSDLDLTLKTSTLCL